MTRRICIVTGTRAEYGLLRNVIAGIRDADDCLLQIVVTAAHLSPEFGLTYREIEADGFTINERVEILLSSDTAVGVSKAMGLGMIGFAEAFSRLEPDVIVVLGDRFEILAAAAAALIAGIPIAHIHGGETTEGAFDESIRHAVTKMSHLHFVAATPYRDRVIQLGENPAHVFLVGGLGIDAIRRTSLLGRTALEEAIDFQLGARNLLVTFHPPTLEPGEAGGQMQALLDALDALGSDTHLIFTMPNANSGGRELKAMIEEFVASHANARAYTSLGQLRYFSCMRYMDGVVGNSSSGIIEAPSFGIGTIDIGDRQRGRLRAASVIDCPPRRDAIESALARLFSAEFQGRLAAVDNPYGNGGASAAIVAELRRHPLNGLLKKTFHDMDVGKTRDSRDAGGRKVA
ncbi:UDP-N-acetylglucosamine 2-epimerase [Sphingomonas sp. MMS24-J13]|uniref:UDP-N-acetylglucosamine 2-epimerase n=1 Tax=Sphingomonas sp. MMS24-J13 TaxID=3238686 RepID=UPI00384B105F